MKLRNLFILPILFCTGCILSTGVPRNYPFRANLGQPAKLRYPMLLVECHGTFSFSDGPGTRSFGYARYGLIERNSPLTRGPTIAELPAGTIVTIDCVRDEMMGDNSSIFAYGHTRDPFKGDKASFAYECWDGTAVPWAPAADAR